MKQVERKIAGIRYKLATTMFARWIVHFVVSPAIEVNHEN
jgi:hypothetical protein